MTSAAVLVVAVAALCLAHATHADPFAAARRYSRHPDLYPRPGPAPRRSHPHHAPSASRLTCAPPGRTAHDVRAAALRCFSNQHVVLMGDSLTRYQYINLAYFLTHGVWTSGSPHNEIEGEFGSWNEFYHATWRRLQSPATSEVCDCHRHEVPKNGPKPPPDRDIMENRYFRVHGGGLNASLTYIELFGHRAVVGHDVAYLNATCGGAGGCVQAGCVPGQCVEPPHWKLRPPETAVVAIAAMLRPSVLVINSGHHASYANDTTMAALARAGHAARGLGVRHMVWKTTTAHRDVDFEALHAGELEHFGRHLHTNGDDDLWSLFDAYAVSRALAAEVVATTNTTAGLYWDAAHFRPFVYRVLNECLLYFLMDKMGCEA